MKKIQSMLWLLSVVLFSSCFTTSSISYKKMNSIQRGMSPKEVVAIMGEPSYRSFNDKGEMLEFRDYKYVPAQVVKIWFVDNRVVEMKGYLDKSEDGCNRRKETEEDEKKEEKKSEKSSSTKVRVTTDGKHVVQIGSLIVTPEGNHETVVSDSGGVIVTASGKHIHVF